MELLAYFFDFFFYFINHYIYFLIKYNRNSIGTFHLELGKCYSNELYEIIEALEREVFFEELPKNLFDLVYKVNDHF